MKKLLPGNSPVPGMSLKRPCRDCPFRTDVPRYLASQRYRQIAQALLDRGESFNCHKTIEFDDQGHGVITKDSKQCAGAMIWLQHQCQPNQLMQIMERLGGWSPDRLDMDAPIYTTRNDFESGPSD